MQGISNFLGLRNIEKFENFEIILEQSYLQLLKVALIRIKFEYKFIKFVHKSENILRFHEHLEIFRGTQVGKHCANYSTGTRGIAKNNRDINLKNILRHHFWLTPFNSCS